MRSPTPLHHRRGFTLIEVIVAAGLCMLIMSVLAAAFASGVDTFSLLKSTGELNARLTTAANVLGDDLRAVHLEDVGRQPLKVSQVRYDIVGTPLMQDATLGRYARPPARGFFRIVQKEVSINEGTDTDGVASSRSFSHVLHMTVRRTPDQPSRAFLTRVPNPNPQNTIPTNTASDPNDAWTSDFKGTAAAPFQQTPEYLSPNPTTGIGPPGRQVGDFGFRLQRESIGSLSGAPAGATDRIFASDWAEVVYFLKATPASTPGANPQPLFSLHRRTRVLTKNDVALTQLTWNFNGTNPALQSRFPGMSVSPATKGLNGPGDITNPNNRMGGLLGLQSPSGIATGATIDAIGATADPAGNMTGEDILLTNVLSFEIKASWTAGGSVIVNPPVPAPQNPLPVRAAGGPEPVAVPSAPPPTPITNPITNEVATPEMPFDDLPLAPSVQRGFSFTQTVGMNSTTHSFPAGSGNAQDATGTLSNARFFADGTFQPTSAANPRIFDTWTAAPVNALSSGRWDEPVFDSTPGSTTTKTWLPNPNYPPLMIRVKAVQIKLRIYDPKNKLTRQIVLVQDL